MSLNEEIQKLKVASAEVMETAARELRAGDNPYRIAAHLEACAKAFRHSHARVAEFVSTDDRPTDDPRYHRGAH